MKYLVLDTLPAVAIPLDALANGAHELKFLDRDYENGEYVYRYGDSQRVTGTIVNSSEIQAPKEKE